MTGGAVGDAPLAHRADRAAIIINIRRRRIQLVLLVSGAYPVKLNGK